MTNPTNTEIVELLWRCGIKEQKHEGYLKVIESCLHSIKRISDVFTYRIGDNVNYELKIKTEDTISPDAGPMWGLHLIIFQVKFIIELVQHYEKLYKFNIEKGLSEQRHRRLMLAVCLAFCHELTHIIRGHDSTVINADSPNNRGSKAAEADADFLAGIQLHQWFTGATIGSELHKDIGLNNEFFGLPVFFKDAGFCTALLSFFFHSKLNPDNDDYHLPNVRAVILLSGLLESTMSAAQEHHCYVNFLFSGYKEHLEYLESNDIDYFGEDEVKNFLMLCSEEEKELLGETAEEMDSQRNISDRTSKVWKALYERAQKNDKQLK